MFEVDFASRRARVSEIMGPCFLGAGPHVDPQSWDFRSRYGPTSRATLVAYCVPRKACGGDGALRAKARGVTAPKRASKEGVRGHPVQVQDVR